MDLIERLRDPIAASEFDGEYEKGEHIAVLLGLCNEAATALEAAREDAERYRWLREEGHPDSDSGVAVSVESWGDWGRPQTTYPGGADLDAAIDQARGKVIVPEQGEGE